jgi:ATP-binding cassette subfamily B protein
MNLFSFLWQFIKQQKWLFFCIFLLSFVWTFDTLFWPFFLRNLTETLTQYDTDRLSSWPKLKIILIIAGTSWIFMEGAFRLRDFLQAKAFPNLESSIRMAMFDHTQRHSPKYFNKHFSGSLSNKIADMVLSLSLILRTSLMLIIPSFFTCIMALVIFLDINIFLSVIVLAWLILHIALTVFFTRKCAHYFHLHGEARSTLSGKIVDSLTNNFVVNLFFRFQFEKTYIASYQKEEKKANHAAQIYSAKMSTFLSISFVLEMFSLICFMAFYWTQGSISTGEVIQVFYSAVNLSMAIWFMTSQAPELFRCFGIAKQALSLMQEPQDILDNEGAQPLIVKKGSITFENVSFCYGDRQIFENKNLHIKAGEKVGLVGYSGAGKSTFVNLILRFFSVKKGKICIDNQDIAHVTLESLRQNIALIPQDPILFHRSLEQNIEYGKIGASSLEVKEAALLAHADEFIQKAKNGYKTLVGERGTKLSGGEKQRIAIARAMLLKAPILILDEATSSLDSVTEGYIQESLEKLMKGRTTIVIAHRLSTLSKMDRIIVFDKGSIIEEGTHLELLKKQGHYAHMWQMQAGGFLPNE